MKKIIAISLSLALTACTAITIVTISEDDEVEQNVDTAVESAVGLGGIDEKPKVID
jgi:hypothetical protein